MSVESINKCQIKKKNPSLLYRFDYGSGMSYVGVWIDPYMKYAEDYCVTIVDFYRLKYVNGRFRYEFIHIHHAAFIHLIDLPQHGVELPYNVYFNSSTNETLTFQWNTNEQAYDVTCNGRTISLKPDFLISLKKDFLPGLPKLIEDHCSKERERLMYTLANEIDDPKI